MIAIDSEKQPAIERLHRREPWARDLAIVGAASALPASFLSLRMGGFVYAASAPAVLLLAAIAGLFGAVLGLGIPLLLHRRVRRKPLALLAPAAIGLGALWGGAAAGLAAFVDGGPVATMISIGASVGAAQLGWLWLPYAMTRARSGSGRWVVAAACALAPAIGWLAQRHVLG